MYTLSIQEEHLSTNKKVLQSSYNSITIAAKSNSDFIYKGSINTPHTLNLLKKVNELSDEEKNIIRQKLLNKYTELYEHIKIINFKQLHFHLKNNHSFLRFHRPKKFGDDLTNVRKTVAYVNENKKEIFGFEEGKIYNGYRFVYPLIFEHKHLGSVEISISMINILNKMEKDLSNIETDFIIKKELVDLKVFKEEQKNYETSKISQNFYNEISISKHNNALTNLLIKNYENKVQIENNLKKEKIFNFISNAGENKYITTFLPVINGVTRDLVGYIVVAKLYPKNNFTNIYLISGCFNLLAIFFIIFTYKLEKNKEQMKVTNNILNEVQKIGKIGHWRLDNKENKIVFSNQLNTVLKLNSNTIIKNRYFINKLIHPDDKNRVRHFFDNSIKNKKDSSIEYRILRNNEIYHIEEFIKHKYSFEGGVVSTIGTIHDITEQKQEYEKIVKFLNKQDNIILLTDGKTLNYANQQFFNFSGFNNLKAFHEVYNCLTDLFIQNERFYHLKETNQPLNWIEDILKISEKNRTVALLSKDMNVHAFNVKINKYDERFYIVSLLDISEIILENRKLEKKVITDKLTGAYNREYLDLQIKYLLNDSIRLKKHLAIAMIDIDYFKKINDTYGHDVGDTVLVELVELINSSLRGDDKLIRWGGEEFLLVLCITTKKDANKILENLREKIEKYNFTKVKHLTCSFGCSIFGKNYTLKKAIKEADMKLYEAKSSGRNKVIS